MFAYVGLSRNLEDLNQISTERRGVRLWWVPIKPKGPTGPKMAGRGVRLCWAVLKLKGPTGVPRS